MIMPDNTYKSYWDLFITLVLVFTCIVTPLRLAFVKGDETMGWTILNTIVDSFFLIDIFTNFVSAIQDENLNTITNRKLIAIKYL